MLTKIKIRLTITIIGFGLFCQAQIQLGNDIDGAFEGDEFGTSVSMSADGKIVAVGAPRNSESAYHAGQVSVYEFENGNWQHLGMNIKGKEKHDWFGHSVAVSGDGKRLAVGSYSSPSIRVYEIKDNDWVQMGQDINGGQGSTDVNDVAISFDGNIIAIGASHFPQVTVFTGVVRIYQFKDGAWLQLGNDVIGENEKDQSGWSISLSADGNILAVGSLSNDNGGDNAGHVRVFRLSGQEWAQLGEEIKGKGGGYSFGGSVSLSADGLKLAIGGHGSLYFDERPCYIAMYEFASGAWKAMGQDIDGYTNEGFGWKVSLSADGNRVAVSSPSNEHCPVRIFDFVNGTWQRIGKSIKSKRAFASTGYAIGISKDGNTIATTSLYSAGYAQVYDISTINMEDAIGEECGKIEKDTTNVIEFNIYPNPTFGKLTVSGMDLTKLKEEKNLHIVDVLGKRMEGFEINEDVIDISFLPDGLYVLIIRDIKEKVVKVRF